MILLHHFGLLIISTKDFVVSILVWYFDVSMFLFYIDIEIKFEWMKNLLFTTDPIEIGQLLLKKQAVEGF